jgi:hypothetical protein
MTLMTDASESAARTHPTGLDRFRLDYKKRAVTVGGTKFVHDARGTPKR